MAEKKIARICWNTNFWRKPSGRKGKSQDKRAFEHQFGFGHEEWLLDTTKIIDGWHYGWLQPIGIHSIKYRGQTFDISLYSIESNTKERWWVGRISEVVITTPLESSKVYRVYKQKGWLNEMEAQLRDAGVSIDAFRNTKPEEFVVLRFRPDSLDLKPDPKRFSKGDSAIRSNRYILLNRTKMPKLRERFEFVAGHNTRKNVATSTYEEHSAEIALVQNRWQEAIYRLLSNAFHQKNVRTELRTGYGSKVDIVVRDSKDGGFIFYEIKTSYSLRLCIREALGQLLEYAYYFRPNNVKKLVVVSDKTVDKEAVHYLNILRKRFGIPIYYQRYDPEKEALEEALY